MNEVGAEDATAISADDMLRVWTRVLGRPVVATDDFFMDLGATSIEALQLLDAIATECGVFLPPGALFEQSTVVSLTAAVNYQRDGAAPLG